MLAETFLCFLQTETKGVAIFRFSYANPISVKFLGQNTYINQTEGLFDHQYLWKDF